ncbi:MAG: iron-sulfur cluster repair di-iron protein [Planctomycetota bacterium]|jgi:regulator of cell morphogenesis and NO signaling
MSITSETTVGRLATEHPLATRVFARHGIDYCCGGGRPLAEACDAKGLDTDTVLAEIRKELEAPDATEQRWDEAPLGDLIDHILETYHRPLDEELPRLDAMARKVHAVHGDKDPERLAGIESVFAGLKAELEQHMAKEEQILFPMIRQGQGAMAGGPVSVMEHEHDSAGAALRRLRELTNGYEVPEGACNTWRALWHGLAALETSLHQHIHLENNILFPRALAG